VGARSRMRTHIEFYPADWEWRDCRRASKRPVAGVGTNDADYTVRPTIDGGRLRCPAYVSWSHMLERCHNEKYQQRNPTYVGTTCVKSWLLFSNFRTKHGFNTPEAAATWRLQTKLQYVKNFPLPPWLDETIVRPRLLQIVRDQK